MGNDHESIIDKALAMLGEDMDGMEGKSAMSHSMDECPDPLNCTDHEAETGDALSGDMGGAKPALTIEIHGAGLNPGEAPSLDDKGEAGDGLSDEDSEILKKLLK